MQLPGAVKVYRKLMLEFHPDHNPQGAECARAINELWQATERDLFAP
jgi:DnaJ-class molecular chaperone